MGFQGIRDGHRWIFRFDLDAGLMGKEAISSASASKPVGPYSIGVKANGFLYMSGQIGIQDGKIVDGGITAK